MSRCPAWSLAFMGFAAGLGLVVFFAGAPRPALAQKKGPTVPPTPQAPTLTTPCNLGGKRGDSFELSLTGTNLADPVAVVLSCPGKATIPTDNKNGTDAAKLRVKVELPADCPIGMHTIRVATKNGVSNIRPFNVDEFAVVEEPATSNRTIATSQAVEIPAVVTGRTDAETSDFFKVKVKAGQTLTFEVIARRIGSPLDPIIVLHDAKTRRELIELYADDTPGLQSDCRLTHTFKDAGEVIVEVRDTTYRGGNDFFYCLRIGEFPGVTTAFPVAVERGKVSKVGFAGPDTASIPAVQLKAPDEEGRAAVYVAPKTGHRSGWPVPVLVSEWPELTEQEPNNEPAKANKLPIPGGISARFEKSGDIDHFAVTCKKGVKYAASVMTYEINSPCEVLIRVLDAKGGEVARSNPAQQATRAEFTPAADGEYVVVCEQLNYLAGPNEIYHLTVAPAGPDFSIALALDRGEAAAGSGTAFLATVTRLNGFAGAIDFSITGNAALSGTATLPAGQTFAFVPVMVKARTKPGAYPFRVKGTTTVNGQKIVRFGKLTDEVKAVLGGIPNPPPELLVECALAVIEKPAIALKITADPAKIEKGKAGKVLFDVTRDKAADGDIAIAPLFTPPNITPGPTKGIAKGSTKAEVPLTIAPAAAVGKAEIPFRATTKIGGKDYAIIPPPLVVEVIEPKKVEQKKKEEPKKDAKKDEKKTEKK